MKKTCEEELLLNYHFLRITIDVGWILISTDIFTAALRTLALSIKYYSFLTTLIHENYVDNNNNDNNNNNNDKMTVNTKIKYL